MVTPNLRCVPRPSSPPSSPSPSFSSPLLPPSPSPRPALHFRSRNHAFSRIRNESVTDGQIYGQTDGRTLLSRCVDASKESGTFCFWSMVISAMLTVGAFQTVPVQKFASSLFLVSSSQAIISMGQPQRDTELPLLSREGEGEGERERERERGQIE